ncbi:MULTISPECIES: ATP-binding protein [Exiguobacterium]|uniref:ATP-binding protein n=1 Tax=Exiguobacterium TaxID=33986 RepID=UPI001BE8904A|nr:MULTISPECIES: ATP-binding protein [Exiguobacterium]MCT4783140.1 ATP-binding protein [Exiguobacterium himgiriensis]
MEELTFTIEDSEIAELLGRQNFSTKESAIYELIKNCYDAGSEFCVIKICEDFISISDKGKGMNEEDIKLHWMHVGKSNKKYKDPESNRVLAGSKGVGRFALARLGNHAKVISKKNESSPVIWETNWTKNSLINESVKDLEIGTTIEISDLRDTWREKDVRKLQDFLNRAYKSTEMTISIVFEDNSFEIKPIFNNIQIGEDYVSKITLKYVSETQEINVSVVSDEFTPEVESIIKSKDFFTYNDTFNLNDEFTSSNIFESDEQKTNLLRQVGDFNAELYFILERSTKENAKKFFYKHNGLVGINTGVILYRNDFSIASHEGSKDWLEITDRARKSPAAATHPNGSWRVRKNQLYGMVNIDKVVNDNLIDLANRQGLDENVHYEIFKSIINFGISRFERYRQSIIRKIDNYNLLKNVEKRQENKKLNEFLKKPDQIKKMTKEDLVEIAVEIKDIKKENIESKKVYKEKEEKHRYDVRILNVLSTQGLRSSALAHELHNKKNFLSSGFEDIIEALVEYDFWDRLNSEEYTQHSYNNVPKLLNDLQTINLRLLAFLEIILSKIEKKKFEEKMSSIQSVMDNIKHTWESQYSWININLIIKNELEKPYEISDDVLEVIFDNLILNSIQHNEMKDNLNINIEFKCNTDNFDVLYSDDGIGLDKKYQNDPFRILEVHETSRNNGHGLGMWIVENTIYTYKGKILNITGDNGFNLEFSLKGRDV